MEQGRAQGETAAQTTEDTRLFAVEGAVSQVGQEPIILEAVPVGADAPAAEAARRPSSAVADAFSQKSAKEIAEDFGKAVFVAEKAIPYMPLPPKAKTVLRAAMPTVKKVAQVAPAVAPVVEPYARAAVEKAREVAPQVASAAKAGGGKAVAVAKVGGEKAFAAAKAGGGKAAEGAKSLGRGAASLAKSAAAIVKSKRK